MKLLDLIRTDRPKGAGNLLAGLAGLPEEPLEDVPSQVRRRSKVRGKTTKVELKRRAKQSRKDRKR